MGKSLLFSLFFLLLCVSIIFVSHPGVTNKDFYPHDFLFHYYKSNGKDFEKNEFIDEQKLADYPPLSSWLFGLVSFNFRSMFVGCLFVFFVLMGLFLVRLSGHWVSALFWVACSAPFFFIEGIISQGVMTFLLLFFVFSGFRFRLVLLLLGLLCHAWGFWLLVGYWLIEFVVKQDWKGISLGICGASFFPSKVVDSNVSIGVLQANATDVNLLGFKGLTMTSWVGVFRWFFLFPLLPFSFMGLWRKDKVWFWFCLIGFIGSFVLLYWRVVESLMPFIVLGLTQYYQGSSKKMRVLLILVCVGLFFVQVVNFTNVIQNVHLSVTTLFFGLPCGLGLLR